MNWTNEKPTKPGWYWYRDLKDRSEILQVGYMDGELVILSEEADCLYQQFMDGQFAGPIPEPQKSGWQPIETAPKNADEEILILFDSAAVEVVRLCWWNNGEPRYPGDTDNAKDDLGWWSARHSVTSEQLDYMTPVAWMPMPDYEKPTHSAQTISE